MSGFVLDNSVAMRWILESGRKSDQNYAERVLMSLVDASAVVPDLWHLEAVNVLLGAERRGDLAPGDVERFVSQLENLPIQIDQATAHQAFGRTLSLSRTLKLSSYDAAYLELAIREGVPLATLDRNLIRAARRTDIALYLK